MKSSSNVKLLAKIKLILCGALLVIAAPLMAMDLQGAMANLTAAKTQGLLGEQTDGYLGVVTDTGNAKEIAKLINEARKTEYVRVAKDNNLSLPDVEAIAGKKAIEKTPAGQFVNVDNKWIKKP